MVLRVTLTERVLKYKKKRIQVFNLKIFITLKTLDCLLERAADEDRVLKI